MLLLAVQEKPQSPTFTNIPAPATKVVIPLPEESENVTRWIVDQSFRKEQERLKIPLGMLYIISSVIMFNRRVIITIFLFWDTDKICLYYK